MKRRLSVLLLLAALHPGPPGTARAGFTTPPLVLTQAVGAAADGTHSVRVRGTFDFENALQLGYPISLLIFQKETTAFARFLLVGPAIAGTSATLDDGFLSDLEVPDLLAAGDPAPAGVRIVALEPDTIRATLPTTFVAGPTTALIIAVLSDGTVLSNPITFTLP